MTAELSSDLASYLSSSLLPIVAFPFPPPDPSTLPTPLLENQALKDLLLGRHLDEVLDHDGQRLVRHAVEGAAQSGLEGNNKMDDLEFDIESSKSRWQVTRTNSATILTAIVMPLLDNLSSSLRSLSLDKSPFVPRTAPPTLITRNSSNSLSSSARPPAPQTPVDSPRPFPTNMSIEELALLAVNAPIGLNYLSLDMEILWANERWWEVAGIPVEEDPNTWAAVIHPEDIDKVLDYRDRMLRDHKADSLDFRWIREDGSELWCNSAMDIARGPDGTPVAVVASLSNIGARKSAQAALERQLALVSRMAPIGLVNIRFADGHVHNANDSYYRISGIPPDHPLDDWMSFVHDDDRPRVERDWNTLLEKIEPMKVTIKWSNNEVSFVEAVPNAMTVEEATGYIASVTNITAEAHAEKERLALAEEREAHANRVAAESEARRKEAVEEKRQQELFLDVSSHELRNPISAIIQNSAFTKSSLEELRNNFVKLREEDKLPSCFADTIDALEEDLEALDSITECAQAQERIANDILGLAQIQLSRYQLKPIEFDLAHSLRNICSMFRNDCRSKGIDLTLSIGSSLERLGPHARVFADPTRLAQILTNLLSNAIRFTAKSDVRTIKISVEVSAVPPNRSGPIVPPEETELWIDKSTPVYLYFSVADSGRGMNEEELSRLFKQFSQASPLIRSEFGGSGLGLWLCSQLVKLQMGAIEVNSSPGVGSTFSCFITARSVEAGPRHLSTPSAPVIEAISEPMGKGSAPKMIVVDSPAQVESPRLPLTGLTILCCEDNQINRTILKRQLTKEGATVLLARDGQEGLDVLSENLSVLKNAGVIIMDIEMPVLDGLAATRAIRELEERDGSKRVRVVGLTGNARKEQIQGALDAGMDRVVTKPYRLPDLLEKLLEGSSTFTVAPNSTDPIPPVTPSETTS